MRTHPLRALVISIWHMVTTCGLSISHKPLFWTESYTKMTRIDHPRTWKPILAGILCIVAGVFNLQYRVVGLWLNNWNYIGLIGSLIGIIAIIGGIFAVRRQKWLLALVGAICTLYPSHSWGDLAWTPLLGVLAVILLCMSKAEYETRVGSDQ